ncbi:hypothetical protein CALCODRAFT_506553 [Calocera cornea HHB12733]|uniref:Uncharacterized protein n=1 Tax=Calocera cornea HHB12733 TaxID=1353952 RepID=A0A165ISI2_9BASI|nr:hypothetical protein CALCODRAFT_506553 [Calocera cornea HHB12733]
MPAVNNTSIAQNVKIAEAAANLIHASSVSHASIRPRSISKLRTGSKKRKLADGKLGSTPTAVIDDESLLFVWVLICKCYVYFMYLSILAALDLLWGFIFDHDEDMASFDSIDKFTLAPVFRSLRAASYRPGWESFVMANGDRIRHNIQSYVDLDLSAFVMLTPSMVLAVDAAWFREKKIAYKKLKNIGVDPSSTGKNSHRGLDLSKPDGKVTDRRPIYTVDAIPSAYLGSRGYLRKAVDDRIVSSFIVDGWKDGSDHSAHKLRIALGATLTIDYLKAAASSLPSADKISSALRQDKPKDIISQFEGWCDSCVFYYLVDKNAGTTNVPYALKELDSIPFRGMGSTVGSAFAGTTVLYDGLNVEFGMVFPLFKARLSHAS